MKARLLILLVVLGQLLYAQNSVTLDYYLPQDISYDPNIPKPSEVIGHEVGAWHITHDKLFFYLKALAAASDRVMIEDRGVTFEDRPLVLLTVTHPENHQDLERIRQDHLKLSDGNGGALDTSKMPIVVYQGFSIHGNESSGANAAITYAYYLAAAQGPEIEEMLKNMVILLDPCMNPDGHQRFAYWANIHKSQNLNPDKNEREYHEVWPGGRTNHYWFDMNRDWLPGQLPESQVRIATFYKWMPNILTDHHEMGTNSTYFFQPGEPSRVHPLTPKINQELTAEIATYHAKALDKIGSLYYSEENFDDYYYGKGSTFPDVNGGIGILFEQGSSRGHIQESENGILTFPFTIRNQFTTALSTVEAAKNMRIKILNYHKNYFEDIKREASRSRTKGYIFGDSKDPVRTWHLAEILHRHKIQFHELANNVTISGKSYQRGSAYVVPLAQKNPRLIRAMFEKRTTFTDSIFYDVSAWTFPLAFNLDHAPLSALVSAGEVVQTFTPIQGRISGKSNYAYLFEWHGYYTPKALHQIVQQGLRAKVAKTPFTLEGKRYDYGTIMIPVQNQKLDPEALYAFLTKIAKNSQIVIDAVATGLTQGIDLGSNDFDPIKKPNVALLVGDGVRSYDAGEIWHLFDTRYQMQITKIDTRYFENVDLNRYTDLIIPSGWGSGILNKQAAEKIKDWVKQGGTVIGYRNVANWFKKYEMLDVTMKEDSLKAKNIRFDQKGDYLGAQVTGGAIFEAKLDRSHPVGYGYKNDRISLFRNTNIYLEPERDSYNNPIQYTNTPLQSGYISEENAALVKNSVPFKAKRMGKGRVILFTDNTNFRAFWYGTNKLLMNAIFFGPLM